MKEPLGIRKIAGLIYYVHDLARVRAFMVDRLDFAEIGVSGPQLTERGRQVSAVFQAGDVTFVVCAPSGEGGRAWRFLRKHPEGVGTVVFEVEDIELTFRLLEERGGTMINDIERFTDEGGTLAMFSITTPFGDTTFRFVERHGYRTLYPGLELHPQPRGGSNAFNFKRVDHLTSNFQTMTPALLWMEHVMGMERFWSVQFHTNDVSSNAQEGSGLKSVVMIEPSSGIKFANNEPLRPFFKSSQINIFAEDFRGDGVQHAALAVPDVITTVRGLRDRGVEFMPTPGAYYDMLPTRLQRIGVGEIDEDIQVLRELEILVDGEAARHYLLQIFLKEAAGRYHDPEAGPFFFEIIQRKGSNGFGAGNFRALFESIERRCAGRVPAKHHIAFRDAEGHLLYEECLTQAGFDGPYTIAYHEGRPHTQVPAKVPHGWILPVPIDGRALAKRHYRTQEMERRPGPPIDARVPLLFNPDVVLSVLFPTEPDPVYFANGDGDDLFYIFEGGGLLRSLLGDVRFETGDYLFVPRGLVHRFIPEPNKKQHWLSIESSGGVSIPKQWRNETGQLRMDAPYCHRDFRGPTFNGPVDELMRQLLVKRGGAFHGFAYDHAPLDVVGWDGTVYPFAFPILNFQPRVGLVHLPPTWHGTFAARGALVCSFVPRPLDFHPEAVPCPYPHASVDCDEFIFYCKGNFTSRRGVGPGSVSHHPAGVPHGPHPGAYEGSIGARQTDELAVMLDTYKPLHPTAAAIAVEDPGYAASFVG